MVADVDRQFGQPAAQFCEFALELLNGLLKNRQLPIAINLIFVDLAFDFAHFVALLQILQFGGRPGFL